MKPIYWLITALAAGAIASGVIYYVKQPAADLGPIAVHHLNKIIALSSAPASNSTSSPTDMSGWKTYTNSQYRFSFKYPANLYLDSSWGKQGCGNGGVKTDCILEIRSSKNDEYYVTNTGFFIDFEAEKYDKPFNFNDWWATTGSELGYVKQTMVGGEVAYDYTDANEVGAGEPSVVLPYNNYLYFISFASNDSQSEKDGLAVYNELLATFKFQ